MSKKKHIRVFATDDHPIIIAGLTAILQNESHIEVAGTANTMDEMFKLLPTARPNILLLDLNLPGTDFFKNIELIKTQFPWIRILIYTSYYDPDLVKSLFDKGIQGFMSKGVENSEILKAIETVFEGENYIYTMPRFRYSAIEQAKNKGTLLTDDFKKRLSLSNREQEILVLISKGLTSSRISETLFISKHTVETHRKNMLRKLDFSSSAELIKFAVQQGLI